MTTTKILRFAALSLCAITFAFFTACEGPQGPIGPVGPAGDTGVAGPAGADGTDGTDGVSGNAECLTCHSSDAKYLKTQQYETSQHSTGSTAGRGTSGTCARCHSNEGFQEMVWSGELRTAGFSFPTRIGCRTCHGWHNENFDIATGNTDAALRTNDPVDLYMYRNAGLTSEVIDFGDNANLCANCHQPRRSWDEYEASDDNLGDGTYDQGSTHFGPHYGAQATTFFMTGAADVGTTAFPTTGSYHANNATCINCHMNEANHSFAPELEGCNTASCHNGSITTLDENTRQLAVDAQFKLLEDALIAAGLLGWEIDTTYNDHPDQSVDEIDTTLHQQKGIFPVEHVGALYNYEWVHADGSHGVHNFAYIEALLTKSLEALQ